MDTASLVTILLMAFVTYLTRISGYLFLSNRTLSPRTKQILEVAPGCVLVSVIAPHFVSKSPADLIALAISVVAAMRLSILPTVVIAVTAAGILRHFMP
jgi:uncharacterized membrane protein